MVLFKLLLDSFHSSGYMNNNDGILECTNCVLKSWEKCSLMDFCLVTNH